MITHVILLVDLPSTSHHLVVCSIKYLNKQSLQATHFLHLLWSQKLSFSQLVLPIINLHCSQNSFLEFTEYELGLSYIYWELQYFPYFIWRSTYHHYITCPISKGNLFKDRKEEKRNDRQLLRTSTENFKVNCFWDLFIISFCQVSSSSVGSWNLIGSLVCLSF